MTDLTAGLPQGALQSAGIGITSTRDGLRVAQYNTLLAYFGDFREAGAVWQHNGDCIGGDLAAGDAWHRMDGRIDLHPPEDGRLRAFQKAAIVREPKPYADRNHDIVDDCAVMMGLPRGFREELRSGTWATIRYARRVRKPLIIIWPDGNASLENFPRDGMPPGPVSNPLALAVDNGGRGWAIAAEAAPRPSSLRSPEPVPVSAHTGYGRLSQETH